jgi:hypothetical protein
MARQHVVFIEYCQRTMSSGEIKIKTKPSSMSYCTHLMYFEKDGSRLPYKIAYNSLYMFFIYFLSLFSVENYYNPFTQTLFSLVVVIFRPTKYFFFLPSEQLGLKAQTKKSPYTFR